MYEFLREFLKKEQLDALLVNSTNEFLVEYNSLSENSRYALTRFSGSTGDAVVTADKIFLFVDGRYHIQADEEVNHDFVTVVKLQSGETFNSALIERLPKGSVLGVVAKKNSQFRVENFEKNYTVKLLSVDPLEKNSDTQQERIEDIPLEFTGKTSEEKISELRKNLAENDAILVSNLEEVSYLFNKRDFSKPYSSKILRRAIIFSDRAELFSRADYEKFKASLQSVKGRVFADKKSVNARDFSLIKNKSVEFEKSPIAWMKAVKTEAEIAHYKACFARTDMAMRAIREYIENNDGISEYDISKKLEKYFYKFGAKSLSFNSIVAKDKNSALAHYSKSSKDEIIQDGSLVLIDCGAYYEGGLATDITRVFVKGNTSELQKRVYTTVLKAFLTAFNTTVGEGVTGFDIDKKARETFAKNPIDGYVFNHGLGHGIGVSVHEYPPNLSCNELAKVELKENMCFTIEPGLYRENFFGVRLENSCYLKDKKIQSFSKMNYEKKLVDFSLLTAEEQVWLKDFEVI